MLPTRWCPIVISWFINPINYSLSTINHSYWSYVNQLSVHELGHLLPIDTEHHEPIGRIGSRPALGWIDAARLSHIMPRRRGLWRTHTRRAVPGEKATARRGHGKWRLYGFRNQIETKHVVGNYGNTTIKICIYIYILYIICVYIMGIKKHN